MVSPCTGHGTSTCHVDSSGSMILLLSGSSESCSRQIFQLLHLRSWQSRNSKLLWRYVLETVVYILRFSEYICNWANFFFWTNRWIKRWQMDYCGSSFLQDLWAVVFFTGDYDKQALDETLLDLCKCWQFFHVRKSLLCYLIALFVYTQFWNI